MRPIFLCLAVLLPTTLLLPTVCRAQGPAPPTLASALAQAAPPVNGLALAVAADKVTLPQDALPPGVGATVPQVAAAFGRITQDFGDVTAVAPPTIPLLNPDPRDPNVYDGMKPRDIVTLLVATLDDAQWAALTGKGGLGLGDLSSDDQRHLFAALFPSGKLVIHHVPTNADYAQAYVTAAASGLGPQQAGKQFDAQQKAAGRDVSADLPQVRLRLGHRIFITLPDSKQADSAEYAFGSDDPAAPPRWEVMAYDQYQPKDTLYGVPVRADAPNALKDGQLDFDLPALQVPVAVAPWKTVGALVAAVARATRLEIYADRRWEGKPLSAIGTAQAQPARNLLRALALCLGGTYRKVGPAYVLTYAVDGVGTIRQRWAEFNGDADAIKRTPLTDARNHISASHSFADLSQTDDPLEPTAAQRKTDVLGRNRLTLTFAQLTPGQQGFVRRYIAQQQTLHDQEQVFMQQHPDYKTGFPFSTGVPTTDGQVEMIVTPELQLLLPSVQGPVKSDIFLSRYNLFSPTPKPAITPDPAKPVPAALKNLPPVPLSAVLAAIPRRAVLAHPRTAADVDALIVLSQKAHLNALYLDVFSGGVSHLNGSPDILGEALARTKGTGIAVFPTLDLFGWTEKAPDAAPDLNILGETSVQVDTRTQARAALAPLVAGAAPAPPPAAALYVSPTAPPTRQTLLSLAQELAARPGLAGLVWREATPPGYAPDAGMDGTELGYTEADRLAFLRRAHVDPTDISFSGYSGANLTLPDFDGDAADDALQSQWQAARAGRQREFLKSLLLSARPLTVLVERTGHYATEDDWYGSWDTPTSPLTAFHYSWETTAPSPGGATQPADVQAKSQSRLALLTLSPELLLGPGAGALVQEKFRHARWDGFILDADATRPDPKKAPLTLEEALAGMGSERTPP